MRFVLYSLVFVLTAVMAAAFSQSRLYIDTEKNCLKPPLKESITSTLSKLDADLAIAVIEHMVQKGAA